MSASDKRTNAQLIEATRTYRLALLCGPDIQALAAELADRLERADAKIRTLEGQDFVSIVLPLETQDLSRQLAVVLQYLPLALDELDAINFRNDLHAARKR